MGRGRNVSATPASRAVTLGGCLSCLLAALPSLELVAVLSVDGLPAPQAAAPELGAAALCSGRQLVLGGNCT